jgi:hypothetical protein
MKPRLSPLSHSTFPFLKEVISGIRSPRLSGRPWIRFFTMVLRGRIETKEKLKAAVEMAASQGHSR